MFRRLLTIELPESQRVETQLQLMYIEFSSHNFTVEKPNKFYEKKVLPVQEQGEIGILKVNLVFLHSIWVFPCVFHWLQLALVIRVFHLFWRFLNQRRFLARSGIFCAALNGKLQRRIQEPWIGGALNIQKKYLYRDQHQSRSISIDSMLIRRWIANTIEIHGISRGGAGGAEGAIAPPSGTLAPMSRKS